MREIVRLVGRTTGEVRHWPADGPKKPLSRLQLRCVEISGYRDSRKTAVSKKSVTAFSQDALDLQNVPEGTLIVADVEVRRGRPYEAQRGRDEGKMVSSIDYVITDWSYADPDALPDEKAVSREDDGFVQEADEPF